MSCLSVPRDAVGVCLLGDRLYAVGGYDGQSYLNTVESYDALINEWTEVTFYCPNVFIIVLHCIFSLFLMSGLIKKILLWIKNSMLLFYGAGRFNACRCADILLLCNSTFLK